MTLSRHLDAKGLVCPFSSLTSLSPEKYAPFSKDCSPLHWQEERKAPYNDVLQSMCELGCMAKCF